MRTILNNRFFYIHHWFTSFSQLSVAQKQKTLTLKDYAQWNSIRNTVISSNGSYMTYAYTPNEGDATLHIRKIDGDTLRTVINGKQVAFSSDSNWLAYLVDPAKKAAKKLKKDKKQTSPIRDYTKTINAFSPDGTMVLTGADDSTARLWDLHGNQIGKSMEHLGSVNSVAFSPDGTTILTNSGDNIERLWKVVTLDTFLEGDYLAPLEKLLLSEEQKKKYGVK